MGFGAIQHHESADFVVRAPPPIAPAAWSDGVREKKKKRVPTVLDVEDERVRLPGEGCSPLLGATQLPERI